MVEHVMYDQSCFNSHLFEWDATILYQTVHNAYTNNSVIA